MSSYLYETHMHTCPASACSDTPGQDYIQKYIDFGYAGIIITDHFFRGNCGIDRSLPWKEFVNQFCRGYEDAKNEGDKRNFPVFFGWEENFEGDEYLIYGLDKNWLLEHPQLPTVTRKQQYDLVRESGGCVVQAHPFRSRGYNHGIYLGPRLVDGIEAVNMGNEPIWNTMALRYGQQMNLVMTAGSDNHHAKAMKQENLAGVRFDHPLNSIHDFVRAILTREKFDLAVPVEQPPWQDDIRPSLPTHWLDENGHETGIDAFQILRRTL